MKINNKSYINKDFQTIYPELVEQFSKLTNRLDIRATNESDPMVVLLKLMGFIGDKQNYNIDINVLQTFLQTVTQLDAFRSQAEINGYIMKYYESASTSVALMYNGSVDDLPITFKPFETKFTDANNEVLYTMVGDNSANGAAVSIGTVGAQSTCYAYEGEDVDYTINGVTNIQLANLDDENKLFFPEQMIASNVIFVKNADDASWIEWKQVENLNATVPLSKVFKFGYDSVKNLPYIEFPNDIEELIGNGINIKYFRTQGVGGNILARKLTQLKNQLEGIDSSYLYVSNQQSAINGRDPETLDEAYKNYKKTVGTFDTLTTAYDFADYLFKATAELTSNPLVSNIQVTDRRTDTNLATPIITYDELGPTLIYKYDTFGANNGKITPFDLVLYPLTYVNNIASDNDYDMTFTPSGVGSIVDLIDAFNGANSIDHTYLYVGSDDIQGKNYPYLYKNMYSLDCRISTTHKVNGTEQLEILTNVRRALYDNFNARKVEYGTPIEFDDLLDVIEEADTRIKNVSLDEPEVSTQVELWDGTVAHNVDAQYVDRVFKNVVAGRMELYNYNEDFKFEIGKQSQGVTTNITELEPELELTLNSTPYTLKKNQVVQLFAENYGVDFNAIYGVLYNYTGATIEKNGVHKLVNDEVLYINTTANGETYTLKYTPTAVSKYNENGNLVRTDSLDECIIQPNFELETTQGGIHNIVVGGVTIGCKMLGTSDKISFLKRSTKSLESPILAYWFTNNTDNALFQASEEVGSTYVHTLDEGEYLFLTDTTKTQLTIFGSGTKLVASINILPLNKWKLNRNSLVTVETFANEDISTYGAINWVTLPISSSNKFSIVPQQVITLTEGDSVTVIGSDITLTNQPQVFAVDSGITYNDTNTVKSTSALVWSIRSRLDLSISYDIGQQLTSEVDRYTEKVIVGGTELTDCWVQSYIPTQTSTNVLYDSDEPNQLFAYTVSDVVYDGQTQSPDINGAYTIKVETYTAGDTITIPVPQVSGYNTAMVLYLNNKSGDLSISSSDIDTNLNTGDTSIRDGMNNLVIKSTSSTVTLALSSSEATLSAIITILPIRLYDGYNPIFHLGDVTDGVTTLETKLATVQSDFYFLYDVPNTKAIDVTDYRDANALWEVNDILNKKTLPQISVR